MQVNISEQESKTASKKVVGTYIPIELYDALKKEADDNFMSISDILRKIIVLHCREFAKLNDERE